MIGSGILGSVIKYKKTSKKDATHFVLCKGEKIRYIISIKQGKKYLANNLASYSNNLTLLMKIINFLPFNIMQKLKLGYFVKATICSEVQEFINKTSQYNRLWNVIVGTYDKKQKLVIQLWNEGNERILYYKIGNKFSNKEMRTEIDYLNKDFKYESFYVPKLIESKKMDNTSEFNIQITEAFYGNKVKAELTEDVYNIFKELVSSQGVKMINNIPYGFSHGDFAPWNMRMENDKYVLFDWEHSGMRFYGFDLIHYIYQIETLLNGKNSEDAIDIAVNELLERENISIYNRSNLIQMYFDEYKSSY